MSLSGWIGVDLDGTLATYTGWQGFEHIGDPIPEMLERVQQWVAQGIEVRVFTARACIPEQVAPIRAWLDAHGLPGVAITNVKDFAMVLLIDDRCARAEFNTGAICARCAEAHAGHV